MRKKTSYLIYPLLIMGFLFVSIVSCEKDDNNNPGVTYGTMTDQDGNVYKTVTIGTQTWMAENLRTTKYNDGTSIPHVTNNHEWSVLSFDETGAYCNYNNTTNLDTIVTYGRLYNWYAVNTGKLAPKGWHVPTEAEWIQLTTYLGGQGDAGGKLKEVGTTHWLSPNIGATNETGFTALPGGLRSYNGKFYGIGFDGYWWCAAEDNALDARSIEMYNVNGHVYRGSNNYLGDDGRSVRCVKD